MVHPEVTLYDMYDTTRQQGLVRGEGWYPTPSHGTSIPGVWVDMVQALI